MKNLYFLFFLPLTLCFNAVHGQWMESFSDGNLGENPEWFGDTVDFMISQERLQLNANEAGNSNLYSTYQLEASPNIEWLFDLELAFAPSQNNGIKICLFSFDSLPWTEGESDSLLYFLKIGASGSLDAVELYKQENAASEAILLCSGVSAQVANPFRRRYKIQFQDQQWRIFSAENSSPYFFLEAEVMDVNAPLTEGYMGFTLFYTSSNSDHFYVDDIAVQSISLDSIPPLLESFSLLDSTRLHLDFSEGLDSSMLEYSNYFLSEMLAYPIAVEFTGPSQKGLDLEFENAFPAWTQLHLQITTTIDIEGNSVNDMSIAFEYEAPYIAQVGDLYFSEILADPSPPVGLPNAEFIELYNASDSSFSLENYTLWNSGIPQLLSDYTLEAHGYLIICKASEIALFSEIEPVLGIENWTSLLNTGDSLLLKNSQGYTLDFLYYSDDWFDSSLKAEGGWTLERIGFSNKCHGSSVWKESIAINGGTPGSANSRLGEEIVNDFFVDQVFIADSHLLQVDFKGELDLEALATSTTLASPPFEIDWQHADVMEGHILLPCEPAFQEGISYHLNIHQLRSCSGYVLNNQVSSFAIPQVAEAGDVVINELLFNAYTGASDFIEIVNRSNKYIDLKEWRIHEIQEEVLLEDAQITNQTMLLEPNEILAFSRNIEELVVSYPMSHNTQLRRLSDLPNFDDKKGKVELISGEFKCIDSLYYDEEMHFDLLDDLNGVSLERVHPDRPSSENSNWVSASAKADYATPGYQNSHYWEGNTSSAGISIKDPLFTPNSDGDRDQLAIQYFLDQGGWQANVRIYDPNGILVKDLLKNAWIENEGLLRWDGLNNNNALAKVGIYIVYFEVFNDKGEKNVFKQSCVLGSIL